MIESLVILGLAAQRLWLLWHQSEIFRPVREWMSRRQGRFGNKVAYFANCQMCTATWAGIITTVLWQLPYHIDLLIWALATTGVIGIVDTFNAILARKAEGRL